MQSGPESSTVDAEQPDLSGEWLYEEDLGSTKMRLDKNGNGTYQWQNGHVITTSVSAHRWQGIWIQEGNDREGVFEVMLSPDVTEAEGTWWYTRIGTINIPAGEKGGSCRLERLPSLVAHR